MKLAILIFGVICDWNPNSARVLPSARAFLQ